MSIFTYAKKHAFVVSVITALVLIIGAIAGRAVSNKNSESATPTVRKVTLASGASFREGNLTVSADGIVQSHSQADLKSQMSAPVSTVNVSIGDSVYAGQVILELQNADIRAGLEQARASLQLAQGQQLTGTVSLASAQESAIDKMNDAYIKGYDVVNSQINPLLLNYDGYGGRLTSYISDYKVSNEITSIQIDLVSVMRDWKAKLDALSTRSSREDVQSVIDISQKNLDEIDVLLGDISKGLNDASTYSSPSGLANLNAWKATVTGGRSAISGVRQALTAAESAFKSSSASQNSTSIAQVNIAQAGLSNLEAQLAKTIIRSPINGKIAALPLRAGELASPGTLLATVVGSGSLEVKGYISPDDITKIKIGSPATIENTVKGTVSNISPSVNALNKKVEIEINIDDPSASNLVVGENVSALIKTDIQSLASTTANGLQGLKNLYILPIQDVKIIPGNAFVFTVDENSKIVKNEVMLGKVQGDFIEVTSGITDDMMIVTPVYELDEGETVQVQ